MYGSALYVTTTAASRSRSAIRDGRPRGAQALPGQDRGARERDGDRDDEEEEAGREGLVGIDTELRQEADEERLAHRQAVDREGDEQDEEEQRSHHVVGPRRQVDADGLAREPDREHAHGLYGERQDHDADHQPDVVAETVNAFVRGPDRALELEPSQEREQSRERLA